MVSVAAPSFLLSACLLSCSPTSLFELHVLGIIGVFLQNPPLYFFETGSLNSELASFNKTGWLAIPQDPPFSPIPSAGVPDAGHYAWLFTYVLGVQTVYPLPKFVLSLVCLSLSVSLPLYFYVH